jgi:hypothetical protein
MDCYNICGKVWPDDKGEWYENPGIQFSHGSYGELDEYKYQSVKMCSECFEKLESWEKSRWRKI